MPNLESTIDDVAAPEGPPPTRISRFVDRLSPYAAILVLVAGALMSLPFLRDAAIRPSDGFIAYFTAARLVTAGDGAKLYDDDFFRARTRSLGLSADDIYYVNPPTTSLLLAPLASMSYSDARTLWTVLSLAALAGSGLLVARGLGLRGWRIIILALLSFFFEPLASQLEHGQLYLLVLALLVVAWEANRSGKDRFLGVALALLLAIKLASAPFWLVLVVQRRWKALGWASGTALAAFFATLPFLPLSSWVDFLRLLAGFGQDPGLASPAYQSLPGLFRQLTHFDPVFSTSPALESPRLGTVLTVLAAAAMLLGTLYVATKRPSTDVFPAAVVLSVLISPLSADYHYAVMLLPIAVLLAYRRMNAIGWVLFGLSVWLIAADLAPRSPVLPFPTPGGYARLVGGMILWVLALEFAGRRAERRLAGVHAGPVP